MKLKSRQGWKENSEVAYTLAIQMVEGERMEGRLYSVAGLVDLP